MQELERAKFEVQEYENYIEVITTVHKECGPSLNWDEVNKRPAPEKPSKDRYAHRETDARRAFEEYKPGPVDKLLRRIDSRRTRLASAIESARRNDEIDYWAAESEYKENFKEWTTYRDLSISILKCEAEAFLDAINFVNPFHEISELGSRIDIETDDGRLLDVHLHVNGEDILPSKSKSLLKSGKVSVKKMTKSRFYELYQDHVCGCALRVGRELFALLPTSMVVVTATADLLNTSTGHLEVQPILSVAMPRATLEKLNFESLDPSDSMNNFVHSMKFLKTKGFIPVDKVDSNTLLLNET
jgi:hypothetical protein